MDSSAPPPPPPPPGPTLRKLLELVRPYRGRLAVATAVVLAGAAVGLVAPRVAGSVVDAAFLERNLSRLNQIVLGLVALFAVMGLLSFGQLYLIRSTGSRMLRDLRERLFSHLLGLTPDFFETRRVGELLSRIGADLVVVQEALTEQIPSGVEAAFSFVGTLVILLILHTKLTLVALAVVPPIVLAAVWYGSRLERYSREVQDALAATATVAEEALAGVRTVQSFGREVEEAQRYGARVGELLRLALRNARAVGGFVGILQFAAFSAFALVLWYGGRLILRGELSPGELTSFLLYTFAIAGSVGSLGGLYAGYRELLGASARVFELLDARPSVADRAEAQPLARPAGRVALRGVRFRYPSAAPDRWALDGVELETRPGEVVGLVGPSGAGKSTLFSLLLRFHDPAAGVVEFDGHDLRTLRLADVRRAVGIVPQEIFLFGGTIAENLRYGDPAATPEQLERAVAAAGAAGFIAALPSGMSEVVGERGVKLSAGQRQRLALARAFLKDPAILLLDEATSALDPESEELVRRALETLMTGRTTFVIAHRLATARRADRILVLDGGRVVEAGTHDALYASNGLYRRYWDLQSLSGAGGHAAEPPPR
ncbi:MAG: ABC transporter ATP-binding protein [Planctomycetes bacterium]|nr:ABC transporter ATP-binding protein [Planctomycetota bacterium]